MFIQFLQNNKFFRKIIYKVGNARAKDMINEIQPYLKKKDLILDIGSGSCNVCENLLNRGYKINPIDVEDLSFVDNLKAVIYDGEKIPFNDNNFDKALILTVLHHTTEPEKILKEAKRVSKKIIIIEDIYDNWFHQYLTYFFDSLLNLEFSGHPHTNKNDEQWKQTFKKLGLKIIAVKYNYLFVVFKQATYYVEK